MYEVYLRRQTTVQLYTAKWTYITADYKVSYKLQKCSNGGDRQLLGNVDGEHPPKQEKNKKREGKKTAQ